MFRSEFRTAELGTKNLTQCLKSCVDVDADGGHCGAVAFSAKTHLCFHSELAMNAAVHAQKIEPNPDYDIFVREDCYLTEENSTIPISTNFSLAEERKFLTVDTEPIIGTSNYYCKINFSPFRFRTISSPVRFLFLPTGSFG